MHYAYGKAVYTAMIPKLWLLLLLIKDIEQASLRSSLKSTAEAILSSLFAIMTSACSLSLKFNLGLPPLFHHIW
jgi:hypothetical protein